MLSAFRHKNVAVPRQETFDSDHNNKGIEEKALVQEALPRGGGEYNKNGWLAAARRGTDFSRG